MIKLSVLARSALVSLAFASAAAAQSYPNKPVRMLVPFPPGGPTDITARTYSEKLQAAFGQPFIVENRPGPNGIIVSNATIAAPADGYTLSFSSVGGQVLTPAINAAMKKPQDPDVLKQLVPVSLLVETPLVLVVPAQSPIKSAQELIAELRANPGKLNFGSDGVGSSTHLAEELFLHLTKTRATHVPFKGTVEVMQNLMSGNVQWSISGIATPLPLHQQGKVRILATAGAQRTPLAPDLPTLADAAGLPGWDTASWFAIFVKTGTDRNIITALHREIDKASKAPDLIARLSKIGLEVRSSTPEQLNARVESEFRKWSDVLATGIKVQ